MARPTDYTPEILEKAKEYLASCVDEIEEYHKTRGEKSDTFDRLVHVRIPTIEGLAAHLGLSRETLYDWSDPESDRFHEEFSYILDDLRATQADRLINGGLSGTYNPTIAKVLLTKYGYREGLDQTSDGKQIKGNEIVFKSFRDDEADSK